MALLDLWHGNPGAIQAYAIRQIVAIAGDGRLREGSDCAKELRSFLSEVAPAKLAVYANECLNDGFDDSGLVLQDIINEVGRRLDFQVENGRFRGVSNAIGYDGIWRAGDERAIVVEVKTTDAYNVRLEKVAEYRQRLIAEDRVPKNSSVLFVVGRKDTGALEAQIRGSRFAWDMRVIGVDSLVKLMQVKEKSSAASTTQKIRELLEPFEYTRLDRIVDVIFDTATDVEQTTEADVFEETEHEQAADAEGEATQKQVHTAPALLEAKRQQIADAISVLVGKPMLRHKATRIEAQDGSVRALIATSKRYKRAHQPYWYAFHQAWREALAGAKKGYFVLGCMDRDEAYAIPLAVIEEFLPKLNITERPDRPPYWHVVLIETEQGGVALYSSKASEQLDLSPYAVPLKKATTL